MKTLLRRKATQRLALTIGILIVYGILVMVRAPIFRTPFPHTDVIVGTAREGLIVRLSVAPPDVEHWAELTPTRVELIQPMGSFAREICIDHLTLYYYGGPELVDLRAQAIVPEGQAQCYDVHGLYGARRDEWEWVTGDVVLDVQLPAATVAVPLTRDSFWYPYDAFDVVVEADVLYQLKYDQSTVVANDIYGVAVELTEASSWVVSSASTTPYEINFIRNSSDESDAFALRFRRPLFDRLVLPHVALIMFVLILLLCFVDAIDTFIEGAVAVFFGIFGLTQVLRPSAPELRTLVDVAIWGLYFGVAGALFHHLLTQASQWLRQPNRKQVGEQVRPEPLPDPPTEPPPQPHPDNTQKAAGLLLLGAIASLFTWLLWKARLRQ